VYHPLFGGVSVASRPRGEPAFPLCGFRSPPSARRRNFRCQSTEKTMRAAWFRRI